MSQQQQQHPHLRGTPTTTTTNSNNNIQNELDIKFFNKLQSTIQTVQSWDDDPMLLAECRLLILIDDIRYDSGIYYEDRDKLITSSSTRFLQRLVRCFKERMTWINSPFCPNQCHNNTTNTNESTCISIGMREGETIEEREGQANRVEVYKCQVCSKIVTFPRYNSVRKLLQTGSGRCGEYANLFGLVCRSMGYETRYILDMTDHVWTEVYIHDDNIMNGTSSHWIMVDSCEAVLDENSMYEAGWGKQLNCIIAVGIDHVIDVTSKYTRKFHNDDFQLRRRQHTTSESALDNVIQKCNHILRTDMKQEQINKIERRLSLERKLLQSYKLMNIWEK